MKIQVHGLSAQYLKQVHEEWLYAQTVREYQNGIRSADDADSGEVTYSFKALPILEARQDRQA